MRGVKAFLVSHTHWDREWYRTFESFRARLVDTIDRVLELLATDPGFRFLLDGQTIVLEDYLDVRPQRRKALEDAVSAGRIAIAWYGLGLLCGDGDSPVTTLSSHTNRLLIHSGSLMAMTVHLEFLRRPRR